MVQTPEERKLKAKERLQRWRLANKDKVAAQAARKYERHRDTILGNNARWHRENPEKASERGRRYKNENRERIAKHRAERYRTDPQFKLACCLRSRLHAALNSQNLRKSAKTVDLIGCSVPDLMRHLEKQFREGMSWDNYGEWVIDHIIPICHFDLTQKLHQVLAFGFWNLQPLWAEENARKYDSLNFVIEAA